MLKRLAEESPTPYGHKYPGASPISFIFQDTYVDIFIKNGHESTTLKFIKDGSEYTTLKAHGFYIARIDDIVKAKLNHGRDKDYISLLRLSQQLMDNTTFVKYLDEV
jgi:hypothetical protein